MESNTNTFEDAIKLKKEDFFSGDNKFLQQLILNPASALSEIFKSMNVPEVNISNESSDKKNNS